MNPLLRTLTCPAGALLRRGRPPLPPLPDGDALLDHSLALFDHAKTIQAVIRVVNSNDRPGGHPALPGRERARRHGGARPQPADQLERRPGRLRHGPGAEDLREGAARPGQVHGLVPRRPRPAPAPGHHALLQGSRVGYALRAVVAQDTSALEEFRGSGRNGTYSDMVVTSLRLNAPLPAGVFQKPGADYREERQP